MVLDVMLPGKDGFEICTDLKKDPKYKHIKIILLTAIAAGTGKPDDYWKQKTTADEFVSKPFSAKDLVRKIEDLLNVSRQGPTNNRT
jgi:CheY-like chemotaxis protein